MEGTKISGLWKQKTKDGKTYLSGSLGLSRLLVLPNDFKKTDSDPDYNVLVVPSKPKGGRSEPSPRVEEDGL